MPFNDIYRLRLYQRLHGAQIVNVMHFVQEDPLPTINGLTLATEFAVNMNATLRARASNQLVLESVEAQSIVPFSGGAEVYTFAGGTVGTSSVQVTSATLAEVITIYSSRGGRRGRGRIYLAGAPTASSGISSQGIWAAGQTTLTANFAAALAARYIAHTTDLKFSLGVWSRVSGPADPPWSSSQFVRATALTVRTIMRTQRRRQVGVGR